MTPETLNPFFRVDPSDTRHLRSSLSGADIRGRKECSREAVQ